MISGLSLTNRLLIASALTLMVFLGLVYLALDQAFVSSVTRTESEKLHSNILLLLAEANDDGATLLMPEALQEARFNQVDSGLYGMVFDENGAEVWRSYSAVALNTLPQEPKFRSQEVGENAFGPLRLGEEGFLFASMGILWEFDASHSQPPTSGQDSIPLSSQYTFALLESADFFSAELEQFRRSLVVRLLGVATVLLIAQLIVLRLGLLPLKRLTADVSRVEKGEIAGLDGAYPKELQRLTDNLNQLLSHEQEQRAQYKNRLSDLAHSLKTPLSIATGALLDRSQDRAVLAEQLQQMDQIVQYQLQRATNARPMIAQQQQQIAPLIERIGNALKKVYSDKQVDLRLDLDTEASCRMDESDLMEMLGNILENSFKYCNKTVHVHLRSEQSGCEVLISDDGPGIPQQQRQQIFDRGQRLDTQQPGQGIGLAVVRDIARSYNSDIEISESSLGGAEFRLRLV
ncbi:MAG: ATP-binding protein [Pseudomonadales bacterium]